jgi:hypothetical protein
VGVRPGDEAPMSHGPEWLDTYRLVILLVGLISLIVIFAMEARK